MSEFHFIDKIICPFQASTMPTEASAKKQHNKSSQKTVPPPPLKKWPNRQVLNQTNRPKITEDTHQTQALQNTP
jgi:hypothetical protein